MSRVTCDTALTRTTFVPRCWRKSEDLNDLKFEFRCIQFHIYTNFGDFSIGWVQGYMRAKAKNAAAGRSRTKISLRSNEWHYCLYEYSNDKFQLKILGDCRCCRFPSLLHSESAAVENQECRLCKRVLREREKGRKRNKQNPIFSSVRTKRRNEPALCSVWCHCHLLSFQWAKA